MTRSELGMISLFIMGVVKVSELPEGEHVVSMVVHNNQLLVATNRHVYRFIESVGLMQRIQFEAIPKEGGE